MLASWILILESHGASVTYGAVAEVIPVFEYILKEYEDQVHNEASKDHVAINLKAAWAKLNDYYNKLNDSPAYYAATILHPRYKTFCDVVWADKPAWLHRNNKAFNTLWAQYNAPRATPLATMPAAHRLHDINNVVNSYINPKYSGGTNSELDKY